jgi:hypothetical protein
MIAKRKKAWYKYLKPKKGKIMQEELKVKISDLDQRLHHMWGYL